MKKMDSANKKEFHSSLRRLVLPIAFQQLMLAVVSASDAVMLGSLDQDAMSAVSLAGQVQFVLGLYLATMTIGTSMFAAQYWGKKDRVTVEKIFAMVMRFTLPVALVFTLGALVCPEKIMGIFTPDANLIAYGGEYLRWVSLSYLLCGISQIYLCVMKNCGRASRSSLISSVCVVLNIVLNAVLIFGLLGLPKLGVAGAAVATVIARLVELVWAWVDTLPGGSIKLRPGYFFRREKELSRTFWKYVTPVLGNEIVWGVGFTMGSVILGHMGADAVAANSIAGIAKNLLICLCMGIGAGGGILIGNELGAGNLERARQYGDQVAKLAILSGAATGLVLLLLSPVILHLVTLTQQAQEYLKWMIVVCSVYCIGKSINSTVIGGIFTAGGDSKFGFLCDTITLWGITVPAGLLAAFVFKWPVMVVYIIINLDEFVKLPAVYRHYKKYKWVNDLTRKQEEPSNDHA